MRMTRRLDAPPETEEEDEAVRAGPKPAGELPKRKDRPRDD